jgi:hypothetical protein
LPRSPEVARRLRASLSANGRFVPLDVWPDLKVFTTWKGGHTRHYLRSLAERCPGVTLRSNVSGSSEAALLVPLRDDWSGGVPALTSTVFELLPEGAEPTPDGFVDLADVKEGEGYRLCVTNSRGMYRYLMEDVFEVEGFERRVPILSFSHRVGLVSSLTGEKLTEEDVLTAVDHAFGALRVRDFQVAAEWGEPPRYLVLVELEHDEPSEEVLITALRGFEEALCAGNSEYESKRRSDRLGDPELLLLEPGAFDRAKRDAAAGRGDAQIKVPRLRRDLVSRDSIAVIRAVRLPVPLR